MSGLIRRPAYKIMHKTSRIFQFDGQRKTLGFIYFTQCKHHIDSMQSWNKWLQNVYNTVKHWNEMTFPILRAHERGKKLHVKGLKQT